MSIDEKTNLYPFDMQPLDELQQSDRPTNAYPDQRKNMDWRGPGDFCGSGGYHRE